MLIQMFSFDIFHCGGVDNVAADCLSRVLTGKNKETNEKRLMIAEIENQNEIVQKHSQKTMTVNKVNKNLEPLIKIITTLSNSHENSQDTMKLNKDLLED